MSNDGLEEVRQIVKSNNTAPSGTDGYHDYNVNILNQTIGTSNNPYNEEKMNEQKKLTKAKDYIENQITELKRIEATAKRMGLKTNGTVSIEDDKIKDLVKLKEDIIEQLEYYNNLKQTSQSGGKRKRRRTKKSKHNKRKRTNRRRR